MIRRASPAVAALMLFLAAGGSPPRAQETTFRAMTDLVTADVMVRSGGKPVTGLAADAFTLLDNGTPQRLDRVEAAELPVDVTLVVDVAEPVAIWNPMQVWWGKPHSPRQVLARLHAIGQAAASVLHLDDRLSLFAVDSYAQLAMPLQPAAAPIQIRAVETGGQSSLYDALAAALLKPPEPGRRHLVVAVHKVADFDTGIVDDPISTATPRSLQEIARRSESVLHVIAGDSLVADASCNVAEAGQPRAESSCHLPMRHLWRAAPPRSLSLTALAALTGGEFHGTNALGFERDVAGTIKDVLSEFRQGYVLRYTPRNVARTGWHEIQVTVPGRPGVTVHARRGYSVEAPPAPPPPSSTPVRAARVALAEAFERGDATARPKLPLKASDAVTLLRDLREAPTHWPSRPRLDATFVLDVAVAGIRQSDEAVHAEALKLLERYADLVRRPFEPDEFECLWYQAAIAGLEGAIRPAGVSGFVDRARARCPDRPVLTLAAAFLLDQRWPLGTTAPFVGPNGTMKPAVDPAHIQEVIAGYEAALAARETAVEARVRLSWFLYRTGRYQDARQHLDQLAGASGDRRVVYLAHLVDGHVSRALGDTTRAAGEFASALNVWPGAQAARVALMTLLLERGDLDQAQQLSEMIQGAAEEQVDPWWMYWQGDYWAYSSLIGRLRGLAR